MKKKYIVFLLFMSMLPASGFAQEAKFKALFMYNFTKYLEWPAARKQGDFVIGIYGASAITQELNVIAGKKTVGTQNIQVKVVSTPAEVGMCHILYVPENKSSKVPEIITQCSGKSVVLITDKPGMAQTLSGLNYVNVDGKQSFEINKALIEKQGVKVNSVLLSLGIVIE